MANSQFCLSSNTYKNQVFEGFSRLQQSDEFVDMTLAAGDEYVKVHKTLIALASPYLKTLLQTIPCQHPVLFLNNVSHKELHLILEYIYTGEVNIPSENIESFLNAARAMHISGLENIMLPTGNHTVSKPKEKKQEPPAIPEPLSLYQRTKSSRFPAVKASITINENDFNLQVEPQVEPQIEPQVEPLIEPQFEPNADIPNIQNITGKNFALLDFTKETAEEMRPSLNIINFNTEVENNNIHINFAIDDDNATNENINLDAINNVGINNNLLTSENIENMPMIIDELPQLESRPFLNIGKEGFTITNTAYNNSRTDITIDSSNVNNPTSFGNFFNIASKTIAENDNPGIGINNLDCGDIETPKTTTVNVVNQELTNETEGGNKDKDKDSILYTISSRGSLQLIMNRFMYYSHYTRDGGRKRRWRCIEYRDSHCPASMDTDGDVIVARKNIHAHPNHDKKIWNKVVKSRVFASLKIAQDAVKEKHSMPKLVPEEVVLSD